MDKAIADRKSFIINFIYFGIIIGGYYFVVKYAFGHILPFVIAGVIAVILRKPVTVISNKFKIKSHGLVSTALVLFMVSVVVALLVLLGSVLVDVIADLVRLVVDKIPNLMHTVEAFLYDIVKYLPDRFEATAIEKLDEFFVADASKSSGSTTNAVIDLLPGAIGGTLDGVWSIVKGVPSFVISTVVTVISCVFMTAEYDRIRDMILGLLPESKGRNLLRAKKTVTSGIGKLLKAYISIMLITFVEVLAGLSLLFFIGLFGQGYDYSYIPLIAVAVAIVDILPVLGSGTIMVPWAIYSLINDRLGLCIGVFAVWAVITVIRQIIEPKLVASQVGLPAIVTVMAMFLGGRVFGMFGILLLPLTVMVVKLMLDAGVIGAKSHNINTDNEGSNGAHNDA